VIFDRGIVVHGCHKLLLFPVFVLPKYTCLNECRHIYMGTNLNGKVLQSVNCMCLFV